MSIVTFQCDQCRTTTRNDDPFAPVVGHWVRVEGHDFCSSMCATKFAAEPLKDSIRAATDWLKKAAEQLDYCPDAPSGDRMDVQMTSRAGAHLSEAIRILEAAIDKAGIHRTPTPKPEGG